MLLIGVILSSVFLLLVLHWWSEGIFDTSEAVLLAVVFCGLIFGLFVARTVWQFLLAFVPLAAAGSYMVYSLKWGYVRAVYRRRCREYMQTIQWDPRNLGAREHLAETLYKMGELDRAVDELQAAVDMGAGLEYQHQLAKWSKERYLRDTPNPVCRWCRTESAPGARKCEMCGTALPYESALSRWITGGRMGRARYYLIVIMGVAVAALSVSLLPPMLALVPLLLLAVALVGWSLVSSARS